MLMMEYFPIFSGHGVYLQGLIKKLEKLNCEISILTPNYHEFPNHEIIDGITVNRFEFSIRDKRWELNFTLKVLKYLIKNLNTYDILHINGHLDIYGFFTIFNKIFNKRIISQMVLLGSDDPLTISKQYRYMNIRFKILSLMDQFLCISKALAESYNEAGLPPEKLTYIPQGVDIDRFQPARNEAEKEVLKKKLGLWQYKKIVIFIGAIVKRKGVDILVNAWKKIHKEQPEALLLMIGQDSFTDKDINKEELNKVVFEIKSIVSSNNYNVKFAGQQYNVEEYLKCSDIFVLPSRKEGFGNVILEAMACGLPAVVTYMDGVSKETVTHGDNGFIVNDSDELADAIIKLLADSNLAKHMGKAGEARAVKDFSLPSIAERYFNLYQSLM
jgi:glycosyltransferase involved in cell wall biosynthesis